MPSLSLGPAIALPERGGGIVTHRSCYSERPLPVQSAIPPDTGANTRMRVTPAVLGTTPINAGTARREDTRRQGELFRMRLGALWKSFKAQPASFWFICFFVFLEYVRPQSIWTQLAVFPWSAVTLTLCVGAFLLEGRRIHFTTIADKWLWVFTLVWLMSCLTAYSPSLSFAKSWGYLSWLLMYVLIVNIVNTQVRFLIFLVGYLLYNFKMAQHGVRTWAEIGFGFQEWGASGAPGWFQNSGEFGIQMTIFFPLSLMFWFASRSHLSKVKSWLLLTFPVAAVISMIASSSRGALLGGAVGVAVLVAHSRYKVRAALMAVVTALVVIAVLPEEQKQRLQSIGEDKTSVSRTYLWERGLEVVRERPVFGAGYANWTAYHMARTGWWTQLPHNMFMEALAELGYTGLLAFLALIGATYVVNARTRRLAKRLPDGRFIRSMALGLDAALAASLASGFFITVLYYPFFWMNLAMTVALHNAALDETRKVAPQTFPRVGRIAAARGALQRNLVLPQNALGRRRG